MPAPIDADTLLEMLFAVEPAAIGRLAALHPAFAPATARALGVPADASLADMARATELPLSLVMAAAWGEIRVPELCGCHGKAGGCGG